MLTFNAEDQELIDGFREESLEHIEVVESQLLVLENEGFSQEPINLLFRSIHTIKGGSGFLGFTPIKELSHKMESLLDFLRSGKVELEDDLVECLLQGTDKLKDMLATVALQDEVPVAEIHDQLDDILFRIQSELEGVSENQSTPQSWPADVTLSSGVTRDSVKNLAEKGFHFYGFKVNQTSFQKKAEAQGYASIEEYLNSFGKVVAMQPEHQRDPFVVFGSVLEGEFASASLGVAEKELTALGVSDMDWIFGPMAVSEPKERVQVAEAALPNEVPEKAPEEGRRTSKASAGGTQKLPASKESHALKVSTELLGKLMTLAGELILCRNQLVQELPNQEIAVLHTLNQRLSELQETVMKTRLQTVNAVFSKVPRMVRDLSRKLDKLVDVQLSGTEVELDRTIIDAISDPLTHLVRNSIDHGFETRKERLEAGKNEGCVLSLRAFHEGGMVNLEIKDDGRGIDIEKLKNKAVQSSLISEKDAKTMGHREALNLIFRPGLSTATTVTEISGRGVGMDVVKTSFEKLGGTVDLFSELGKGTTVLVKLPTTLAIVPAIVVDVEGQHLAIPQGNVEEIVRIKEKNLAHELEKVGQFEVFRLRGDLLPVIRLADVLKIPRTFLDENGQIRQDRRHNLADRRSGTRAGQADLEQRGNADRRIKGRAFFIVIVRVGVNQFGILVNRITSTEEVVVKPLSHFLKGIPCFHGSTIRGDGRVMMIVDCNGLAKEAALKFAEMSDMVRQSGATPSTALAAEMQSMLLFDYHASERFAVPLNFVTRIEKIKAESIVTIGDQEYVQLNEKNVQILRLHQQINTKNAPIEPGMDLYLIIPAVAGLKRAILATKVHDVVEIRMDLDEEEHRQKGVLGRCIIQGKTVTVLDLYGFSDHNETMPAMHGKTILLAEDTPFFRVLVGNYLKELGYRLLVASDGEAAWKLLQEKGSEVDLLLTDIEMPHMNGFELVQNVRRSARFQHLPVVALTALTSEEAREKGRAAGFEAYLVKLDKALLAKTLHRLFSSMSQVG
jgi:two-component system chemotaxis sensor kinase CheA